ncbi:unnamed protein product [Ostreobium quekettii]|uniref:UBA domain-containing protein n=1 Tax=Ostreobium quekettii TaxID=121088 RepID=A0A8S1ITI6_9CHLO|nr:unnamed protein product [Ostreobium quekettii]|eukprot:evm.model.scf_118.1 EVM.evm.TU.scf_118.1   scf_118:57372-62712(+)
MLAFVPIGRTLERHMGTLKFAHLIGLIIILGEAIYLLLAYTLTLSMVYPAIMLECPIGFSGVVFGLIVIDTKLSGASQRSILGLFTVPAALYPWALLVFWQLMIPRISFFGHLCGILVGEMYVRDWLQWVVLSTATVERMEDYSWLSCCTHRSSYVSLTTAGPQQLPTQSPGGSGWSVPSMSWLRGNRQQQPALADPGSVFAGPARTVGGERRDGDVPPWAHVEAELTRVEAGASAHALGTVEPSASYPELPTHIAERQPLVEEPQPSGSDGDQGAAPFDDSARQQLLEMGFKPQAIQAALRAADGDVERAVEILTGQ